MAIASEQAVPAICPRGPLRLPPTSGSRPMEAQLGVTVRAAPGPGPRARAGLQECRLRRLAESAANAQRHSAATLRRKKLKPRCQLFRGLQLAVASLCPCGELKQKSIFQHRRLRQRAVRTTVTARYSTRSCCVATQAPKLKLRPATGRLLSHLEGRADRGCLPAKAKSWPCQFRSLLLGAERASTTASPQRRCRGPDRTPTPPR